MRLPQCLRTSRHPVLASRLALVVLLAGAASALTSCGPTVQKKARYRSPGEKAAPQYLIIDGNRERVFWNDGDSFRITQGSRKDAKARLYGYNTLESYGPVHFWGGFHGYELYDNAKAGMRLARSREWICESREGGGGYGRILVDCPGLRLEMLRTGLAHAFAIGHEPLQVDLDAQHEAQREGRGMWAKGVPAQIVTSIHSQSEYKRGSKKRAYNRICDSKTGLSEVVEHSVNFHPCDAWCHEGSCMIYVPFDLRYRYGKDRILCMQRGRENRLVQGDDGVLRLPDTLGNPMP